VRAKNVDSCVFANFVFCQSSKTLSKSAGMPKFTTLKGVAAPLDIQNIDTDMIIPKQYLKTIKRSGLGVGLFSEMRYLDQDPTKPNPDFMLNKAQWKSAKILVAGNNFGCGSSREHAPWAINDFGIRAVIASGFADIFFNNCFKNGMLPVVLPEEQVRKCMQDANAGKELEIDLPNQVVILSSGEKLKFDVDPFRKNCLIEGLDDIGITMKKESAIAAFEKKRDDVFSFLKGIELAKV
jgi:3-isopropylmalate dehydratase small subunit